MTPARSRLHSEPPSGLGDFSARRERIYKRHAQAAIVRSRASAVMWLAALLAELAGVLSRASLLGVSVAVAYLILLNPPTLWLLRRLRSRGVIQAFSIWITVLEILGYTAIIHFAGGIEAANLTLIYAAVIAYVGVLGRSRLPFLVAALSSLAFSLMVVMEYLGWLPHWSLAAAAPMPWKTQATITLFTACLLFIVAALASRAAKMLWRSKDSVQQSERRFRGLAENAPGLVFLFQPGPPQEYLYVGGLVEPLLGLRREEFGRRGASLLDYCHPDDRRSVIARQTAAIKERASYVIAYRLRHDNGEWRWVEERGRPILGDDGELRYFEGIVVEITDRKALEKEITLRKVIQQAAHEWRLTFDTVESPILLVDNAGCIRRLNRAARDLIGRGYEECEGLLVGAVGEDEPWPTAEALVSQVVSARAAGPAYRLTSSDDKHWDLSAIVSPRFVEERVVLILQDVTRIFELEDSLMRGEKLAAMGALVGGVAHEVRNPLFGISASLDAMKASFDGNEELMPYVEILRSQVDRMTVLMNGLLEYGRSAGAERAFGSLREVLEQSLKDCAQLARERGVRIETEIELEGELLSMNREGLVSLFTNLLSNAIQHSPMGSKVVLEARAQRRAVQREDEMEQWVDCAVRDSGSGFSEEALARACEPFFTRRQGGMGLGLAIVERIVDAHGGRLSFGNRPEGGARVEVRLPGATAGVSGEASVASL